MKIILCAVLAMATAVEAKSAEQPWQAQLKDVVIVPKDADATKAFAELRGKGGARVLTPRSAIPPGGLLVPPSLRFKEVSGRTLIDAVAAARKLSVAWPRDGATAVLYAPASDATVERLRRDMASANGAVRGEAFGVASWMSDPRIVSTLVNAAKAADTNNAPAHIDCLTNVGWDVVLALDDSARDLLPALEKEYERKPSRRHQLIGPILQVGDDRSIAILERALADEDSSVRFFAQARLEELEPDKVIALIEKHPAQMTECLWQVINRIEAMDSERAVRMIEKYPLFLADDEARMRSYPILARIGSDKALAILDQGLTDSDTFVRMLSLKALAQVGTDKALQIMEGALADTNESWRYVAPNAVLDALAKGNAHGDKAVALIEQAMTNVPGKALLNAAIAAMGRVGGEKAAGFVMQAFTNDNPEVRAAVTAAIGQIGGEQALALLEKAGADTNAGVRASATTALGDVGGDRAWALLWKAAADPDDGVRKAAAAARKTIVAALGKTGGEQALTLLEKAVADPDAVVRQTAAAVLGQISGEQSLALLGRIIADPDAGVRKAVAQALCLTDVPGARGMMLAQLASEQNPETLNAIAEPFFKCFPGDWKLEKALHEAQERLRQ